MSRAIVQSLEQRICLAATLNGSALVVTGTGGADEIEITLNRIENQVEVRIGDEDQGTFDPGGITLVRVNGLGGNDSINVGEVPGDALINGGAGNDTIFSQFSDEGVARGVPSEIRGAGGDDAITGTGVLRGGKGNDNLFGQSETDSLFGDAGNDTLSGQGGNDFLMGGPGADSLSGSFDNDQLFGEAGRDILLGSDDDDTLFGGNGADLLNGGLDDDLVRFDSKDTLPTTFGNDTQRRESAEQTQNRLKTIRLRAKLYVDNLGS